MNFLKSVLKSQPGQELTDIELVDQKSTLSIYDKYARLDILGRTSQGVLINIDIQIVNQYNIEKSTLFYWAKIYQGQLQSGQNHATLKKTITINVVNFKCLPDDSRYHNTFHILDDDTHHPLNNDLEIHFLKCCTALLLKPGSKNSLCTSIMPKAKKWRKSP
ncbi:Rpn family recombination-promoting nuclease/putative transposase [Sporomusa sphaeroides]|uniref:Rpn family recombination-promoting nuclease/putative transposase n=1 Tax=Sporomusa sphaeroides TaxID=47679 RepID=UPI003D7C26FC